MGNDPRVPKPVLHSFGYMYLADTQTFADHLREAQQVQAACGAGTRHGGDLECCMNTQCTLTHDVDADMAITLLPQGFGIKANVGFLQRPERVVLLVIGALSTVHHSNAFLANRMPQVLWVLAIGSFWTFIHRMFYIWKEIKRIEGEKSSTEKAID